MLKIRIIPCLDVKDGRVVKGTKFAELNDAGDIIEQAKHYSESGADELCFLDITASSDNRNILYETIEKVAECCFIPLTVGGGIRQIGDIRSLLKSGADKVSIGTSAVLNPEFVREAAIKFGNQCIVVSLDIKKEQDGKYYVFTHGGRQKTDIDAIEFARKMSDFGAGEILINSINQDGTKVGFDNALNKIIADNVDIPIIASGGAGNLNDFVEAVSVGHANAVLAASVFHFGILTVEQVKQHLFRNNIPVRL